jgi:hypothetical protein
MCNDATLALIVWSCVSYCVCKFDAFFLCRKSRPWQWNGFLLWFYIDNAYYIADYVQSLFNPYSIAPDRYSSIILHYSSILLRLCYVRSRHQCSFLDETQTSSKRINDLGINTALNTTSRGHHGSISIRITRGTSIANVVTSVSFTFTLLSPLFAVTSQSDKRDV